MINFLLPHGTWSPPPPRRAGRPTPYADWLLEVFRRWMAPQAGDLDPPFEAIIASCLGEPTEPKPSGSSRSTRSASTPTAPSGKSTRSQPPTRTRPTPACT